MNIVLYGSQYGNAERYAKALAEKIGYEVKSCEDAFDINAYDNIIYLGGLYAESVRGMKKAFRKAQKIGTKHIAIVAVGLSDPQDETYVQGVKEGMKRQLPEAVAGQAHLFYLRGGIDYARLTFMHKKLLGLLYKKMLTIPEEQQNASMKAIIETYDKTVDFVDFRSLESIIQLVSSWNA